MAKNMFSKAKTAGKGVKAALEEDRLGGGGVLPTGIYPATIQAVYLQKARNSDAMSANFMFKVNGPNGPFDHTEQIWMTNRNGEVTYKDKKDGSKKNLPGFSQVNSISILLIGKEVGDLEQEEKTLKLWDYDAGKELPKQRECFTEFNGVACQVALQESTFDRKKANSAGEYVATGETVNRNELVKVFPEDKRVTLTEIVHFIESLGGDLDEVLADGSMSKAIENIEESAGIYAEAWLDKNAGKVRDRTEAKSHTEGKAFKDKKAKEKKSSKGKKSALFDD